MLDSDAILERLMEEYLAQDLVHVPLPTDLPPVHFPAGAAMLNEWSGRVNEKWWLADGTVIDLSDPSGLPVARMFIKPALDSSEVAALFDRIQYTPITSCGLAALDAWLDREFGCTCVWEAA